MSKPNQNASSVQTATGIGVVVVALFAGKTLFKIAKRVPVEDVVPKSILKADGVTEDVLRKAPQPDQQDPSMMVDVITETGELAFEVIPQTEQEEDAYGMGHSQKSTPPITRGTGDLHSAGLR